MRRLPILLFLPVSFLLLHAGRSEADLITFHDFEWGSDCCTVELKAGGRGFRLERKTLEPECRELVYKTAYMDRPCTVTFTFTPITDKLFSARVVWEESSFGYILVDMLKARYRTPREEMPQFKLYIWSRKYTELELRHDEDTTLTYSNLNLWKDYCEERKLLKKPTPADD